MEKLTSGADQSNLAIVVPKNSREEYRVAYEKFNGRDCLDVRLFYTDDETGEPRPTKKGLCISLKKWPALRAALNEMSERLEGCGLLEPEGTSLNSEMAG